ncbi:uncharacterized protein HMPREF1541_09589 [Cyphellophora europaea CBS 101466]|uniref:Ubiquinol-cytochrome-c reductase cytochrome c1 n=1 Tax=Cyphellophora europaea (strain CBS 101466) TaxID=1220924 RepID=W2SAK1_CYPE1|nr:uncharacterized protein HMPREF1541_09589 [Cyphellophora europaea CBS 101466]ETN45756.1 hypothetical protein HMPREF1541_09589 [Cyphellophora europaea CBS 101466]
MAKFTPDERSVYLAFKNVFKGPEAQIRTSKKIRKLVQNHQNETDIRDLITEYNHDNVCNSIKSLLEQQIFESTLKAKLKFPEVFDVSPTQSADRAASEAEAAQAEVDVIHDISQGQQEAGDDFPHAEPEVEGKGKSSELQPTTATNLIKRAPSLYPVYLPYANQHRIMRQVQDLLERACYSFGQDRLAGIMSKEKWTGPESVELNIWATILKSKQSLFDKQDIANLGKPLAEVLESITSIRHTAVHRLHVTVTRLEQYLSDAELLANLLHDDVCANHLSRIRREVSLAVDELKLNKDVLESKVAETLKKLAAQRLAIVHAEAAAVEDMLRQDRQYQAMAGSNLERRILESKPENETGTSTERDDKTDFDPDTDTDVAETNTT